MSNNLLPRSLVASLADRSGLNLARIEPVNIKRQAPSPTPSATVSRNNKTSDAPGTPLMPASVADLTKIVALSAIALYAYKSVKDDGVDIGEGRRRSIFTWIDVGIAAVISFVVMRNIRMLFS